MEDIDDMSWPIEQRYSDMAAPPERTRAEEEYAGVEIMKYSKRGVIIEKILMVELNKDPNILGATVAPPTDKGLDVNGNKRAQPSHDLANGSLRVEIKSAAASYFNSRWAVRFKDVKEVEHNVLLLTVITRTELVVFKREGTGGRSTKGKRTEALGVCFAFCSSRTDIDRGLEEIIKDMGEIHQELFRISHQDVSQHHQALLRHTEAELEYEHTPFALTSRMGLNAEDFVFNFIEFMSLNKDIPPPKEVPKSEWGTNCNGKRRNQKPHDFFWGCVAEEVEGGEVVARERKVEVKAARLCWDGNCNTWRARFRNIQSDLHDLLLLVLVGKKELFVVPHNGNGWSTQGKRTACRGRDVVFSGWCGETFDDAFETIKSKMR